MNRTFKIVATMLALVMVLMALPTAMAAEDNVHVLDVTTDLEALSPSADNAGKEIVVGDYFTVILGEKTKIDSSNKSFDDGYEASQRLNFQHKSKMTDAGVVLPAVKFTTSAAATVKLWWVEGGEDNRQMVIFNEAGEEVVRTADTLEKNAKCISELKLEAAGTYYLGTPDGSNYLFKMEVTEEAAEAPVEPAPEAGVTEIYAGTTGGTGWFQVAEIYTTVWGGTLDPNFISEDGYLSIYFTGSEIWSVHFALNGAKWAQVDREIGTATQLDDGSYVVTIPYADLIAAYGTNDLSGLGAVYLYTNCADTGSAVITRATYTAAKEEAPTEPAEPETTAPAEPETTVAPTQPGDDADKTGDMTFVAIFTMLASAVVLVTLTQKKRAF